MSPKILSRGTLVSPSIFGLGTTLGTELTKRNMKNRRRKLLKTKEPEEVKENQESKKDDSRRSFSSSAILDNVVDKRRKLEDISNENNARSRYMNEDAVTIDNNIELQIEMEELSAVKVERGNDVQSIQKALSIKTFEGQDKSRKEAIEDLANQDGMLQTKKCGKQCLEKSLKQGIDKGNDLTTDDVDDNDINDNNNCGYTCPDNQDVHTIRSSPSSGDGPTCQFVANSSSQVKKPIDLAARCQSNTNVSDELNLPGKNHTETTCVSPSIDKKNLKNLCKGGDKIINMSCEVSEKMWDFFPHTNKKHENDSYENQNRASKNDFKINDQSAVNACHTSDVSCLINTTEIHMVPDEIHTFPYVKIEAENLNPCFERMEDLDKEDKPTCNSGPSSNHPLVDCLFDKGEVSELELKQRISNPGVASAYIPGADNIHMDNRQAKDITDTQLCDVDWMSQFPEEISPNEPVQVCQDADQSVIASSKYMPVEDGSAIMAGFIKELSQLNKMLLKTKREMENARKQKKTSSNM